METSSFAFLEGLHAEAASVAVQAERDIWEHPRGTLSQGRLFGELLAKAVSVNEKMEPVYSIKQVDRLFKLGKEGLLSEEIRSKFEWLRMNGNAAVHGSEIIHADVALTAHRHMFELACWYTELYGSPEQELPAYRMPLQLAVPEPAPIEVQPAISSDFVEKIISDQLETKLIPTLDEKFRGMEEALRQIAESRQHAGPAYQPSPPAVTNAAARAAAPAPIVDSDKEREGMEVAVYLQSQGCEVIDKRNNRGSLWVLGGWELKELLSKLRSDGLYFRFARGGSASTNRKPAWFLLDRSGAVQHWVSESMSPIQPSHSLEEKPEMSRDEQQQAEQIESARPASNSNLSSKNAPEVQKAAEEEKVDPAAIVSEQENPAVHVPDHLLNQPIDGYASPRLAEISAKMGIAVFGDWTEEKLLELYEKQRSLLHDTMIQLWFFGFEFEGKLERVINLKRSEDDSRIGQLPEGVLLSEWLEPDACRMLQRLSIARSEQLSHIPVSSLAWLLRGRHEGTVERLKSHEVQIENEQGNEPAEEHDERREPDMEFYFEGQTIRMSGNLRQRRIEELPILGCAALIRGIQENWHMTVLGDLPEALSILPSRIKGVGNGAVAKFFAQLSQLTERSEHSPELQPSVSVSYAGKKVSESGLIVFQGEEFAVNADEYELRIDSLMLANIPKLITEMLHAGWTTIGQIPVDLAELQQLPRIGQTAVQKFHMQLCEVLKTHRQRAAVESAWAVMTHEQRIEYAIGQVKDNWQLWLQGSDRQRGNERQLEVLRYRWEAKRAGKGATLEETGQHFGVTRERIRQIEATQLAKLARDIQPLRRAVTEACEHEGSFFYPMTPDQSFEQYTMLEIMQQKGWSYLHDCGLWTKHTLKEIEEIRNELRKRVRSSLTGRVIDAAYRNTWSNIQAQELNIPIVLLQGLVHSFLQQIDKDAWIAVGSSKASIAEAVLRQYPQGVEIYKKASELVEAANRITPGEFEKERDITSIFSRDESSDVFYLWGRGIYIHSSFVHAPLPLLEEISFYAESLLEQHSPISIGRLYTRFDEELNSSGIANEYALYTLLRRHSADRLQLRKFPHVWHKDDDFKVSNGEMLKNYIREKNAPVTLEALKQEFVVRRGWKNFTVDYNISNDTDFVQVDFGVAALREFYHVDEEFPRLVNEQLKKLLAEKTIIHAAQLFEAIRSDCDMRDIRTSYLLYDLVQDSVDEKYGFVRYPWIALEGHEWENVSVQGVVEQYVLEQGAEVPREQVWQWLTEELGAREASLDLVLSSSRDIFYYTRGRFGEYIHRDNLGWTQEQEDRLLQRVEDSLNSAANQGLPYVLAEQVLIQAQLPHLRNDLPWSKDLLVDALKKSKKVKLLGSYDEIIVSMLHPQIQNESDFVAYILKSEFKGQASIKELHRRLAQLRYSKDGQLLQDSVLGIEQGIGKVRKEGDFYFTGN
ncbi:sigma factor-like helix-turn-helix DNA-binding protein [Saccharibacillus alkalitolerans]|uniref:RNA polymerase sigma-70 domain-containing protein n=1 Tax=Saccharibacillus alkalitolerans TaxID=2705290 RepID=A0ABX0EZA6_9BACL|nr:sigma factor-like helix-turn-helix DNA-binding protein [Saccharibacillus alkalitolerans]NGZ74077.1 hypothetical protein [Saccharibacillus alkalitolerans]